jgi:predicted acetyltransferase
MIRMINWRSEIYQSQFSTMIATTMFTRKPYQLFDVLATPRFENRCSRNRIIKNAVRFENEMRVEKKKQYNPLHCTFKQ